MWVEKCTNPTGNLWCPKDREHAHFWITGGMFPVNLSKIIETRTEALSFLFEVIEGVKMDTRLYTKLIRNFQDEIAELKLPD